MPYKLWVVGEEVLAADFNTMVQEQVVATFANAADRTADLGSPRSGQLTYLVDVGRYEYWTGTAWKSFTGVLALQEVTTAQTGITTSIIPLNGLATPALTIPANRRIEITCAVNFTKAGADTATWAGLFLLDNGGQIQVSYSDVLAPGFRQITASRTVTPTAGNHTYSASASTGAGFLNTQAASNSPNWLRVTDLGSA